jgi:citrate lyase subunit beta / citryl-CoA lyase
LEASVWRGLDGVILPKVERAEQVREAEEILANLELERGVTRAAPAGEVNEADDHRTLATSLELHLSLETAQGNHEALGLMNASPRVRSASLGRADLVMDLRPEPSGDLHLLPYLMQRLIMIANTTRVTPIGAWWQATSRGMWASPEATHLAARLGRDAGFKGALCVDPEQVEPLNRGFSLSDDEAARATQLIAAFAEAERAGRLHGELGGWLVDRATADAAQSGLNWAEACRARDSAKAAVQPA